MTVICLLACTFFIRPTVCTDMLSTSSFFSAMGWKTTKKKKQSKLRREPSPQAVHLIPVFHLKHGVECSIWQTDYSSLKSNSLSDNHTELLSCQENINYFILIKVAESFYIWKCHWRTQRVMGCLKTFSLVQSLY